MLYFKGSQAVLCSVLTSTLYIFIMHDIGVHHGCSTVQKM